jgi:hypothetical protein
VRQRAAKKSEKVSLTKVLTLANAFLLKVCHNHMMLKFLAIFTSLISLSATAAGLGFNPFEKHSPTSPTAPSKPSPSGQVAPVAPSKPAGQPLLAPKQEVPPVNKNVPQQTKK